MGVIEITHPFHPWRGRRFATRTRLDKPDLKQIRILFGRVDRDFRLIPVAWTDLRHVDAFEEASRGRSLLRYDDVLSLRVFVDELLKNEFPR